MLSYAAHRRTRRQLSPATLAAIIGVHAVALGLLATTRMDVGAKIPPVITDIFNVPPDTTEPPPPEPAPQPQPAPRDSQLDQPKPIIPAPPQPGPPVDSTPVPPETGPIIGPTIDPLPLPLPPQPLPPRPLPQPVVKAGPVLATSGDRLRPPYPEAKRRLEEEAVLRLRLGVDERGRVTSADPVGGADPLFLSAARAHLLRYWRYKPATEDGRAVPSTLTITLRFELDEE